jgi:hypothetical protein
MRQSAIRHAVGRIVENESHCNSETVLYKTIFFCYLKQIRTSYVALYGKLFSIMEKSMLLRIVRIPLDEMRFAT